MKTTEQLNNIEYYILVNFHNGVDQTFKGRFLAFSHLDRSCQCKMLFLGNEHTKNQWTFWKFPIILNNFFKV